MLNPIQNPGGARRGVLGVAIGVLLLTGMAGASLAKDYGAPDAIALAHRALGELHARTLFDAEGQLDRRAEENFLTSIDLFQEIGNEKEAARSLVVLAQHLVERGDPETAKERLREARAIFRRMGLPEAAEVETTLGELERA